MNCGIVSRLVDQFLVARIDPEPCACVQLACVYLSTSRVLDHPGLAHPTRSIVRLQISEGSS